MESAGNRLGWQGWRGFETDTSRAPWYIFLSLISIHSTNICFNRLTMRTATISTLNDSDRGSSISSRSPATCKFYIYIYVYTLLTINICPWLPPLPWPPSLCNTSDDDGHPLNRGFILNSTQQWLPPPIGVFQFVTQAAMHTERALMTFFYVLVFRF